MEPIAPRTFAQADRQAVHDAAVVSATTRTELHIDEYVRHPDAFGGRYVGADLFKETFASFRESAEARSRYNAPVHNAAAVLAAEQLRRMLALGPAADAEYVILLTGTPGAGKTSTVLNAGGFPPGVRAIYEGQLSNPATAMQKVEQVIDSGHRPAIVVVHPLPEEALRNTLRRFSIEGRGAGVGVMADIQGGLQASLAQVRARFGDDVDLFVNDVRDRANPRKLLGWKHLNILGSEGTRDDIEQRLRAELERQRVAGVVSVEAFRQAHGAAPLGPYLGLAGSSERGQLADEHGRRVPGPDRAAAFAHRVASEALTAHPELRGSYLALDALAVLAERAGMPLQARQEAIAKGQVVLHAELERGHIRESVAGRDRSRDDGPTR
jgi:hypothetical protein